MFLAHQDRRRRRFDVYVEKKGEREQTSFGDCKHDISKRQRALTLRFFNT